VNAQGSTRRRRLAAIVGADRATSLVELAVVMMLLSIVMLGIIGGLVSFQRDATSTDIRLQNLDEGRVLMAATTKDLRTATHLLPSTPVFPVNPGNPAVVIASDREVEFYANIDTTQAPQLVHIYVDNTSELIETTTAADAGSVAPNYTYTGTPKVRYVGRYVANPVSIPIFSYYDANGVKLTTTPLSVADGLSVVSIGVTFAIAKSNGFNVPVTTLVNRVYLPNVYYNPLPASP
jgi:Tfp pilus assembly protein PilW